MPIEILRPANREAWLQARKNDVTASDAACLLGIHPSKTALDLWAEKTGRKEAEEDNEVFLRGREMEFVAIKLLRKDYPDWKITHSYNNRYFRDPEARIGATPDAFVQIPDRRGTGIVQVKSVSDFSMKNWRDPETKEIFPPLHVAVQAIIEATLTGSKFAFVALIYCGHGLRLYPPIEIPLHPELMKRIRGEVADFWQLTDRGLHPDVDWKRDGALLESLYEPNGEIVDLSSDNSLPGLCDERATLSASKSAADKRLKEIKTELLDKLGGADAGRIADGRLITAKRVERAGYEVKPTSWIDVRVKAA